MSGSAIEDVENVKVRQNLKKKISQLKVSLLGFLGQQIWTIIHLFYTLFELIYLCVAQSTGAVEYTDCFSAEG